jgi:hypothetical protein
MAAGTPLTRLTLGAASVADDLGYVALSDLARALGDIAADFRARGGALCALGGGRAGQPPWLGPKIVHASPGKS